MGMVLQPANPLQASSNETTRSVSSVPTNKLSFNHVHELGVDNAGGTIQQTRIIPSSNRSTRIVLTSEMISTPAERMKSPEYLASIRRRTCSKIKEAVVSLAQKSDVDDFEVYTFKPFNDTIELLARLSGVQSEGNTREILRQIRDTFFDGGHERYRETEFRDLIAMIFQRLADAIEVTPDDADKTWDALYDHGVVLPIHTLFLLKPLDE